jgi:hypothetical protein
MPTNAETNNNPSEFLPSNSRAISKPITDNVSGLTYGLTYTPNASNRSALSPTNLVFDQGTGISNGYASRVNGITDFTAYNQYIHHSQGFRYNVFPNLIKANFRFEIYSRQYR